MQQHQPLLFCLVNRLWRLLEYKRSHYYRALNLTHTQTRKLSMSLVTLNEANSDKTNTVWPVSHNGRTSNKKSDSEKIHRIQNCVYSLSLRGNGRCVKKQEKKTTQKLARLLRSVKPRSTVYTKMMVCAVCPSSLPSHVCACFLTSTETKEISRGIWNDYGSASYRITLLDSRTSFSQVFLPLPSVYSSLSLIMLRTAESLLSASAKRSRIKSKTSLFAFVKKDEVKIRKATQNTSIQR